MRKYEDTLISILITLLVALAVLALVVGIWGLAGGFDEIPANYHHHH